MLYVLPSIERRERKYRFPKRVRIYRFNLSEVTFVMFCRYCGDIIPDDSIFCQKCGKKISTTAPIADTTTTQTTPEAKDITIDISEADTNATYPNKYTFSKAEKPDNTAYSNVIAENIPIRPSRVEENTSMHKIEVPIPSQHSQEHEKSPELTRLAILFSTIALAVFILFFILAAPGYNTTKIISYAIGVTIATGLYITALIFLVRSRREKLSRAVIWTSSILCALCVILSCIYAIKVDDVLSREARDGYTDVLIEIDYDYFSRVNKGAVISPYAYVKIGSQKYYDGDVLYIAPNYTYSAVVCCGHSQNEGRQPVEISLPSSAIKNGHKVEATVDIGNTQYAEITLTFTQTADFWTVIFS